MLRRIDLRHFKCFTLLKLPLCPLTLLSGANASGKSSVLQALALLHQSMREDEWAGRLMLNGAAVRLGAVSDVIDQTHGRRSIGITLLDDEHELQWEFMGGRTEMSMEMRWLTRGGPFWDEDALRRHGADDYLEYQGEVVTDHALGEAAYRTLHDMECALVSFTPSDWDFSPVAVTWRRDGKGSDDPTVALENWRDAAALEKRLRDSPPPVRSWDDLRKISTSRFGSLTFAGDCFDPLEGTPFVKSAADRLLRLLDVLDRFACAFDADGARTSEGHRIYQDHFTGMDDQGWFSDSSDMEKSKFGQELTFSHPDDPEKSLFCTWHGKVRHPALRLHFSWPIRCGEPVYVVYAGPKITKR